MGIVVGLTLSLLAVLSSLGAFSILVYLSLTHARAPRFSESIKRTQRVDQERPLVSIVVTARNEVDKISKCLDSLSSQAYPNLEIIVVDDSSTDGTRKIVSQKAIIDPRIKLVDGGERQEGWVGKSWPCWRGYTYAAGPLLLFVDADSQFGPTAVQEAVGYLLSKNYDVLSISPRVKMKGVWASATLPLVSGAIDLLYPMTKVNDPHNRRAYVFGTFILIRRGVYEAIDGHRGVRALLVEDAALAQAAKSKGYALRVEIGTEFLSTDWEHERSKIYSGLERITSSSIKSYGLASNLNAVLLFFIAIYPILFLLGFAIDPNDELIVGAIASILNVVFFLTIFSTETKLIAESVGVAPFLYPLGALIFMSAIITTSIKLKRGAGIQWKDRSYRQ